MSYLEILRLNKEPFSNSPDPDAYYSAQTHSLCLNRLEIALRLRRGLNVVLGRVGTGKSTLCRRLLKTLTGQSGIEVFFLLDPGPADELGFVRELCELFGVAGWNGTDVQSGIDRIQETVFDKGLKEGKNLILLVDEGQKLSPAQMEVLRVLLNFETNTEKLLQIVIFAQPEFREKIDAMPNFKDRINECLTLAPLSEEESMALMRHRLTMAGGAPAAELFTPAALKAIYRAAEGRPRQLVRLGHQSLLAMIMANRQSVDAPLVNAQVARNAGDADIVDPKPPVTKKLLWIALAAAIAAGAGYAAYDRGLLTKTPAAPAPVPAETAAPTVPAAETPAPVTASAPAAEPVAPAPAVAAVAEPAAAPATEAPAPVPAPEAPAAEPAAAQEAGLLGRVMLGRHMPLKKAAELFYSTPEAFDALAAANPGYEGSGTLVLNLPKLAFDVPAQLKKNSLLAIATYKTADEAFAALETFKALNPRFLPRENADGTVSFHLTARASFRAPERAWLWLSSRKAPLPAEVNASVLPPYGADEKALCAFE